MPSEAGMTAKEINTADWSTAPLPEPGESSHDYDDDILHSIIHLGSLRM